MAANVEALRAQLEKCARRFHETRLVDNAQEHKWWKFENCPSEVCKEARKALGMPTATLADLVPAKREPGEEC